jgi:hypothetical protein
LNIVPDERISHSTIRTSRPYATEEEFLEQELDMMSRAGMVLVGVAERPTGTIVRFEVALASGAPLLRGEGRVVGYTTSPKGDKAGLALRFTRLDTRSKALVDRATALRAARGRPSIELQRVDIRGDRPSMPPLVRDSIAPPSPHEMNAESTGEMAAISPLSSSGETPALAVHAATPSSPPPGHDPPVNWGHVRSASIVPAAREATARAYVAPPESGVELSRAERREHLTAVPSPSAKPIVNPVAPPFRSRDELLARLRARARNVSAESVLATLRR